MNFSEIETKSKNLSNSREILSSIVQSLYDELEAIKQSYRARINSAVARVAERHEQLRVAIGDSPELFTKPRTQVFHGIRVGYRKGTGGIDWDDNEKVAAAIKRLLPDKFDVLVKTTHTPQAKALGSLDVSELKKIGCTVESTGDVIVIKPFDSEVEKTINALLKGAMDEAQKEAA